MNSTVEYKTQEPYLKIKGGNPLKGQIEIEGSKNAALPAIIAACMSEETVELKNVPLNLNDIKKLIELLQNNGAEITVDHENNRLTCNGKNWQGGLLDGDLAGSIRASLYLLGLAVHWNKDIQLPIPGGCKLGQRKHDMHIDALKQLNNKVTENQGIELAYNESSEVTEIEFYYPTFGGTLNVLFASVGQKDKKVIIRNAAKNPEIIDVIFMLNNMGANISWEDDRTLTIIGVEKLSPVNHYVMPDRIVGATIITATGATNGQVTLKNFDETLLATEVKTWKKAGLIIEQNNNDLMIDGQNSKLEAIDVKTRQYPGFHTDIQPLHVMLMTFAHGNSQVKETILDGRFRYASELNKMGADIIVKDGDFTCVNGEIGQIATINGPTTLTGAEVIATDIRGGAAVAVAGLAAKGTTIIKNLYQLERGYGNFVELFSALGGQLERISNKK